MSGVPENVPNTLMLEEIRKEDIPSVGGKGASLGEMASLGLPVPKAFVVTAQAFRRFLIEAKSRGADLLEVQGARCREQRSTRGGGERGKGARARGPDASEDR